MREKKGFMIYRGHAWRYEEHDLDKKNKKLKNPHHILKPLVHVLWWKGLRPEHSYFHACLYLLKTIIK